MYRFAIVGCGSIAARHAENIAKVGKLRAVCDVIPERANCLGKQYQATTYYSIEDILKNERDVDIIVVCTPNGQHAE
ncbi:MAG: Gfo/Idh/MocA family oxidoreductase, partial [Chitinophagaceae bacterium]|nr:Gfo/Idh/MocA family oxidoreductase [Chitinophagaceae bacterium]